MRDFLTRLAEWFTGSRRAAIQATVASIVSLLLILGATTSEQATAITDLTASVLVTVQGIIGLTLLRRAEWYTWLDTTGRGIIYTLGSTIGITGIAFQLWGSSTAETITTVTTAVASIIVAAVQMVNTETIPD